MDNRYKILNKIEVKMYYLFEKTGLRGKDKMSYKNLEIWKLANEVIIEIHKITLNDLPPFEMYETGSQIRRSSKSVKSNIVEGYGRRQSKREFLQFLYYALGSNYETLDHLETLVMTGSLKNKDKAGEIEKKLTELGKKLKKFIQAVKQNHNNLTIQNTSSIIHDPQSTIHDPQSTIQDP